MRELSAPTTLMAAALRKLLALPVAQKELAYLDKGIGTKTKQAAWLEAREALAAYDNLKEK